MAEQLDVRSVFSIVRRRRRRLAVAALVGGLLGAALVTWHPPLYSSTSTVLLPQRPAEDDAENASWEASTQVRIAESAAVLGPAAKSLTKPLSQRVVRSRVSVRASTADVLSITARGETSATATELARAVAEAEVAYQAQATSSQSAAEQAALQQRHDNLVSTREAVDEQITRTQERLATEDPDSPGGRRDASALSQLTAQQTDLVLEIDQLETRMGQAPGASSARVIEEASPAERPRLFLWYLGAVLGMALLAVTTGIAVLVHRSRRDAKLGTRDEIADAVGSEVVAALRSDLPRSVAAWGSLLRSYRPSVAEGWAVRQALAGLGLEELAMRRSDAVAGAEPTVQHQLCVLSLAEDARALPMGPQLASYAASIGISTRLVPEQGDATASLWAACSSPGSNEQVRPHLRVASRRRTKQPAELTVVVAALDRRAPRMPRLDRATTVVLAVSSRAASSEDLARVAVAAYEAGFRISGVLVADPDPFDQTTGRLLPHERLQQPPLPSRVGGPRPVPLRDSSWTGGVS